MNEPDEFVTSDLQKEEPSLLWNLKYKNTHQSVRLKQIFTVTQ